MDRKIFSYSAEIDFEFLAGETYWVSIYAVRGVANDDPFSNDLSDDDFGVLLNYSDVERERFAFTPTDADDLDEFGELFSEIPPNTTQANPFRNNNAVLYSEFVETGSAAPRWFFSTTDVEAIFTLNP